MKRSMSVAVAMWAALGCSNSPTESAPENADPAAFTGTWRSVTPTMEFIRMSVESKSSEMGALGVRLTYSGVAFDGSGRIDGDSLVADLTVARSSQPAGVLIAHLRPGNALRVEQRYDATVTGLTIDFVREP